MKKTLGILFIILACILGIFCGLIFFVIARPDLAKLGQMTSNMERFATIASFLIFEAIFAVPAGLLLFFGVKMVQSSKKAAKTQLPSFPSRIINRNP